MNSKEFLSAKYRQLAERLGDLELQIHTLTKIRDEVRTQMLSVDQSLPDFAQFEKVLTAVVGARIKETYEKKAAEENEGGGGAPAL